MPQDTVRVFISSVFKDFTTERTAARNAIDEANGLLGDLGLALRYEPVMLDVQDYARILPVEGALEREVNNCQALVLILGRPYGTKQADGRSATEQEYDHARAAGLPVLAFLEQFDEPAHLASLTTAKEKDLWARQEYFRKKAAAYADGCYAAHYRDAADLRDKISNALQRNAPNLALHPYFAHLIAKWESGEEAQGNYYLPLRAAEPEKFHEIERIGKELADMDDWFSDREEKEAQILALSSDMRELVLDWLARPDSPPLFILGEYGTGKTRFLLRLAAELARAAQADQRAIVPLYVPLGEDEFRAIPANGVAEDMWAAVAAYLASCNAAVSRAAQLRDLLRRRRCVMLLDGLDELPQSGGHRGARDSQLVTLIKPHDGAVRTLLTGRTHYFPSERSVCDLIGGPAPDDPFNLDPSPAAPPLRLHICPFSPDEVADYLRRRCGKDGELLREKLSGVYNLLDMARRPVLLNMIVTTVEDSPDRLEKLTPGRLYEAYARKRWELERKDKDRLRIDPAKLWPVMEYLGCRIHLDGMKAGLTNDDIEAAIMRFFPNASGWNMVDEYSDALRCSSFLKWSGPSGAYEFIHRSYGEFFAARALVRETCRTWSSPAPGELFCRGPVSQEIAAFAADLLAFGPVKASDLLRCAPEPATLVATLQTWFLTIDDPHVRRLALLLRDYLGSREEGAQTRLDEIFAAERQSRADERQILDCGDLLPGLVLCRIPAGEFIQGGYERGNESPIRRARITRPFWLADTPVTQAQWAAVMTDNPAPSWFKGPQRPVEQVAWFDCVEFCNRLSDMAGLDRAYEINGKDVDWHRAANGYRLPTEAEWEYACRAGTTSAFFFGNRLNTDQANFNCFGPYGGAPPGRYRHETTDVRTFNDNAWGAYDMHGNVCEWCWDKCNYGDSYADIEVEDPVGPPSGALRVVRGGSWDDGAVVCRSALRGGNRPGDRDGDGGFRVVRRAPQD